ncbi:hypothetical protein POM88_020114 [Heracleum sosnowskyi]|uniref:Uncharacterized protein n=1 Tax=Heracleum sosnowskyi TaxID=360622 RepID=A0AAD8IC54_9APIA|nr:hypothetical protein POM88_020114 [Heracleum sosnowskyi]
MQKLKKWRRILTKVADFSGVTVSAESKVRTLWEVSRNFQHLKSLNMSGCNSSVLACTLSERLFQTYSGFGRQINIYIAHFPEWIKPSGGSTAGLVNDVFGKQCLESTWSVDLLPNVCHNIFGLIICFRPSKTYSITYSLKNVTSDFIWSSKSYNSYRKSLMVVVPRSIFLVRDGDHRIELKANVEIYGIHLLNKMIEESTNVSVEEAALVSS